MTFDITKIKTKLTEASIDELRDLLKCVKDVIPDDTDNSTNVGFRTTRADKRLLYNIAEGSNTTVSAICRTAIHDALQSSFGGE